MNKRKIPKAAILLVAALMIYFGYTFIVQQKLLMEKAADMQEVQRKVDAEEKLNTELKQQKAMSTSDETIERIARERLDMVRRGERVFIDANK